ncbi:EscU/YscU/HrcU family type III secretion system export apparatus switch protein [Halalkalibacterium halodurans]|jgi:flagellar biosynthesis protein|uniref:Flagellar biosynthesis n=2 Tax=Halalkalibacterium halodurans TaxID=86665 RepID=Q9KA18_HALH5|nr:EscU/YscU/HrcU family type III secretion system export apparatus switch protein [Halalkalibacterium halodurans]MDY7223020.1 EscU/YscU/HrcU family type III secretion system export apparatus switch protein [Halalkalibacterium halodurans]MDY7242241.1 EscU/YscU/HrcU family type III secretion system export apparatus switch protein [Halalkalibacterium halodurans]MED3646689.1 EscU/YscU/HrcU family type III secretion system export apparatus switch protein [Halalkalibacterium halodurans]MED4081531.1 
MRQHEERRQAVAVRYNREKEKAPRIIGKGKGLVADELIKRAEEAKVPIQKDPSLVELLGQLEINETIPEELYEVVAELFAFIYQIDQHSDKS